MTVDTCTETLWEHRPSGILTGLMWKTKPWSVFFQQNTEKKNCWKKINVNFVNNVFLARKKDELTWTNHHCVVKKRISKWLHLSVRASFHHHGHLHRRAHLWFLLNRSNVQKGVVWLYVMFWIVSFFALQKFDAGWIDGNHFKKYDRQHSIARNGFAQTLAPAFASPWPCSSVAGTAQPHKELGLT